MTVAAKIGVAKRKSDARTVALGKALDDVRGRCDVTVRRAKDPVDAVHRYTDEHDREIVALLAACVAFGNVTTIRAKLDDALGRLGKSPARAADDELGIFVRMHGWVHRVFRGEDVARLVLGARRVQRSHGLLGLRFRADLDSHGQLRLALAAFCDAIRTAGGLAQSAKGKGARRGPSHILPDPMGSGGSKRLLLFLRWMIRPADGVDLGMWPVLPSVLLCPVDTHIHKIARNLGFTQRSSVSWETAEEITQALARFDPEDPVKYDFSLCHMGMLQRCPSKRDARRCEGCGVKPVCRHWNAK